MSFHIGFIIIYWIYLNLVRRKIKLIDKFIFFTHILSYIQLSRRIFNQYVDMLVYFISFEVEYYI